MNLINQSTKDFINANINDDVKSLALKTHKTPDLDLQQALEQIAARQIAKNKIPSWAANNDVIFPQHLSLEQCSSELTALHKANIIAQSTSNQSHFIDLTGGLGVDCFFISQHFDSATYIEMNEHLCSLATHNFEVLNASHISVTNSTAEEYLKQASQLNSGSTTAFIDPHRRNTAGGKVFSINDCTPNVCELQGSIFEIADNLFVKLSPMLDISLAVSQLSNVCHIDVVSLQNECKELIFHCQKQYKGEISITCTNIFNQEKQHSFSTNFNDENNTPSSIAEHIKQYIYEPNSSLLKAGLFKTIAANWNIEKLHQHSHLYTSGELIEDFHGRSFEVLDTIPFNKKSIKHIQQTTPQANIATRNFPMGADALRNKIKIKDGGETFIFGTTTGDNNKVLIVSKRIN